MTKKTQLTATELTTALCGLPEWSYGDQRLSRVYVFKSFISAIAWMSRVAPEIDARDHHPNWSNVYNRVEVALWSHDAGGVTSRDVDLARVLEDAFTGWSD